MNNQKGAELIFLPLYGKWLGVAMKVVTSDKQQHIGLSGSPTSDLSTDCEAIVTYQQPFKNPNRITLHFFRSRKNPSLPMLRMAACRFQDRDRITGEMKIGESFGFSLEDCNKSTDGKQQFLQLAYLAKDVGKLEGFEDLYVKIEVPLERGFEKILYVYLKITLTKRVINSESGFMVRAEEVSEKMVPAHLRKALLSSETRTTQS